MPSALASTAAPPSAERAAVSDLRSRLNRVIRGKAESIELVLVCLLARGHLLIEDRPGLGKTTLAKALSKALGGDLARVQCTPDLLPSDITGFNVLNQKSMEFEFRSGPVFADVLLADEINRATPRTQSALLEAMAERQVTVDGRRHPLAREFFVIATQNPADQHGTYPLPEAQLDRFAMKLQIGYPAPEDELQVLRDDVAGPAAETDLDSGPVLLPGMLGTLQARVAGIAIAEPLQRYLVEFANATRRHRGVMLGLSPRGLLVWQRASQAQAFLQHRAYVIPADIRRVAPAVLAVRLGVEGESPLPVIEELLKTVPLPEYTESVFNVPRRAGS